MAMLGLMLCIANLFFSIFVFINVSPVFANELKPGGDTSLAVSGTNAYSQASANLSMAKRLDFSVGNSFFSNPWVMAPASTTARDGLGPLFNTNACQACHIKDGRGHAPDSPDDSAVSMVVRLSRVPHDVASRADNAKYGPNADPVYGHQIQDFAIPGVNAEAKIEIHWREQEFVFPDGERASLRSPSLRLTELSYGELSANVLRSIRVAPPMIGLGLLEAISEQDIVSREDIDDDDRNGISGKANRVWDVSAKTKVLGRFGWKAGQPSLRQQNAAAFRNDLGIVGRMFEKDDCQSVQQACLRAENGGTFELDDNILDFVTFYTRNLAVPDRQPESIDDTVFGKALFSRIGCADCHTPSFVTGKLAHAPEQSSQMIWPYTDMLLHDMGDALADERPEFLADGREWRTPPLWGLSQLKAVNGHTQLLHDARARNVQEAILWHGGEAEASKQAYVGLSKFERGALIEFVESL